MATETEPNMTCQVCGGTWGDEGSVKHWNPGEGGWWEQNRCPADCHDAAKWKALAQLEKQAEHKGYADGE